MSRCLMNPVACAKAFGGVLIGKTIANEEPIATPINKVATPPNGANCPLIAVPAVPKIGTNNAAVAVWEIKFAIA